MAEFSEVIKTAIRMCNSQSCIEDNCPLNKQNNGRKIECNQLRNHYPKEFEAIVMKWAKEHPVITNRQKLGEIMKGVFEDILIQGLLDDIGSCEGHYCITGDCSKCENNGFWDKEYQPPKEEGNE